MKDKLYQITKGTLGRGERTGVICTVDKVVDAAKLAVKRDPYLGDLVKVDKVIYNEYVSSTNYSLMIEVTVPFGETLVLNWSLSDVVVCS